MELHLDANDNENLKQVNDDTTNHFKNQDVSIDVDFNDNIQPGSTASENESCVQQNLTFDYALQECNNQDGFSEDFG